MTYSVGEVAKLAKVSIRTLHHYDEIGLLRPSQRNEAGYRFYTRSDLDKLQLIRFYRTLEFPLDTIRQILGKDAFDREAILLQQRELLLARTDELSAAINLINDTLADLRGRKENTMDNETMFAIFPEHDHDEAERQWGHTRNWQQMMALCSKYQKEDWLKIKEEMAKTSADASQVFRSGAKPDSHAAITCAEADRLLIDRFFYSCSRQMHANVKQGVSKDPRFVANIDKKCPGLAVWMAEAAAANLRANGEA